MYLKGKWQQKMYARRLWRLKTSKQVIADPFWGSTATTKVRLLFSELKMQKVRQNLYFQRLQENKQDFTDGFRS